MTYITLIRPSLDEVCKSWVRPKVILYAAVKNRKHSDGDGMLVVGSH
jgi:hypothetical protein